MSVWLRHLSLFVVEIPPLEVRAIGKGLSETMRQIGIGTCLQATPSEVEDPNRDDDPAYIIRLIGQVFSVWKR